LKSTEVIYEVKENLRSIIIFEVRIAYQHNSNVECGTEEMNHPFS